MAFGGVEALLIPAAAAALGVRFVTDVPSDLANVVPLVQLVQFGGGSSDDAWRVRNPNISVDSFAVDRLSATALAERVEQWFRVTLPGSTINGTTITKVQTITGASWRPWDDVAVRRMGASYRLTLST